MGYGDNTKAALMTRGIAEMARLGMAMGADFHTFNGLSGVGDLIVTCTSMHSRNRRAGILIGQGKTMEEADSRSQDGGRGRVYGAGSHGVYSEIRSRDAHHGMRVSDSI